MRYLFGFLCVCALGVVPLVGCSEDGASECEGVADGTACSGGECFDGVCASVGAFHCTEQGVRNAIAAGGGPYTFDCDGPTTVVTEAEIAIAKDVILDGQGNLTVDGNDDHRVFSVPDGVTVELDGFAVTGGSTPLQDWGGAGIQNRGTLTLINSTVSDNAARTAGAGISNLGTLTLTNSTISRNMAELLCGDTECGGGGIYNIGVLLMTNSTVSGNSGGGIMGVTDAGGGSSTIVSSTVVSEDWAIESLSGARFTLMNTVVDGRCITPGGSLGYNIESPGNTCGFDHETDLVNVSADDLKLGELADNGGPTMTHALAVDSVAIGHIPAMDCEVDEDQRGEPRPETGGTMCDVGSVERSARDAALASYCAAVLECFPDDESCEADFVNLLWVGSGGDFAACTSAKVELVECVASLDCDKLGGAREDYFDVVIEECHDQLGAAWQTCEVPVK